MIIDVNIIKCVFGKFVYDIHNAVGQSRPSNKRDHHKTRCEWEGRAQDQVKVGGMSHHTPPFDRQ